jgi:hypothetical protein
VRALRLYSFNDLVICLLCISEGAVDGMVHKLARKLSKYKDRRKKRDHASGECVRSLTEQNSFEGDEGASDDIQELGLYEEEAEAFATKITKVKRLEPSFDIEFFSLNTGGNRLIVHSFSMVPITAEEAAICLDYIDHPFYVFRSKV